MILDAVEIIDGWMERKDLFDMPEQLDKGAAEGPSAHLTGWEANEKKSNLVEAGNLETALILSAPFSLT